MRDVLLFTLERRRFALPLETVRQVSTMVEISPLPGESGGLAGMLNLHGDSVPVIDLRRLWRLPARPFQPSDHLLVVCAGDRVLALAVDAAEGVGRLDETSLEKLGVVTAAGLPEAVATRAGELVLLVDPEGFFAALHLSARGEPDVPGS